MQARGTLQDNSDRTKITSTEISATAHHRKYRVCSIIPAKLNAYFLKSPQKTQTKNLWKKHNWIQSFCNLLVTCHLHLLDIEEKETCDVFWREMAIDGDPSWDAEISIWQGFLKQLL